jgi:hypothetical protein
MLAARLLGIREFGLGALVEKILGIKLDKGPQKADWARRPLTERMEVYARNDTHYLKEAGEPSHARPDRRSIASTGIGVLRPAHRRVRQPASGSGHGHRLAHQRGVMC